MRRDFGFDGKLRKVWFEMSQKMYNKLNCNWKLSLRTATMEIDLSTCKLKTYNLDLRWSKSSGSNGTYWESLSKWN